MRAGSRWRMGERDDISVGIVDVLGRVVAKSIVGAILVSFYKTAYLAVGNTKAVDARAANAVGAR